MQRQLRAGAERAAIRGARSAARAGELSRHGAALADAEGALAAVGICGCIAMALGDGAMWTWLGLTGFLVALVIFVWVNIKAVVKDERADSSSSAAD